MVGVSSDVWGRLQGCSHSREWFESEVGVPDIYLVVIHAQKVLFNCVPS